MGHQLHATRHEEAESEKIDCTWRAGEQIANGVPVKEECEKEGDL